MLRLVLANSSSMLISDPSNCLTSQTPSSLGRCSMSRLQREGARARGADTLVAGDLDTSPSRPPRPPPQLCFMKSSFQDRASMKSPGSPGSHLTRMGFLTAWWLRVLMASLIVCTAAVVLANAPPVSRLREDIRSACTADYIVDKHARVSRERRTLSLRGWKHRTWLKRLSRSD